MENSKSFRIKKITQILPSQDFFRPKPEFLKFLKGVIGNKSVIECGAGNGLLTKKMREVGLQVLPIDLFDRESDFLALKQDATTFDYPKNSVALISRPSRGDWIHNTIFKALQTSSFVIYIGLPSHVEEDIDELSSEGKTLRAEEIYQDAGEEGEVVYKISSVETMKKQKAGNKYYLVKHQMARDFFGTSWFEDGGNKWLNFAGGYCPKSNKDVVLEEQMASDLSDLDWKKTSLYVPDSDAGWLDRNGNFTDRVSRKPHASACGDECEPRD